MSDKQRKKKDGGRKDKKRTRKATHVSYARAGAVRPSTDQADLVRYKPGSAMDRNRRRAPAPVPELPEARNRSALPTALKLSAERSAVARRAQRARSRAAAGSQARGRR